MAKQCFRGECITQVAISLDLSNMGGGMGLPTYFSGYHFHLASSP